MYVSSHRNQPNEVVLVITESGFWRGEAVANWKKLANEVVANAFVLINMCLDEYDRWRVFKENTRKNKMTRDCLVGNTNAHPTCNLC